MPIRRAVLMMRHAISPRLAIRMRLNIPTADLPDRLTLALTWVRCQRRCNRAKRVPEIICPLARPKREDRNTVLRSGDVDFSDSRTLPPLVSPRICDYMAATDTAN